MRLRGARASTTGATAGGRRPAVPPPAVLFARDDRETSRRHRGPRSLSAWPGLPCRSTHATKERVDPRSSLFFRAAEGLYERRKRSEQPGHGRRQQRWRQTFAGRGRLGVLNAPAAALSITERWQGLES
ncbi:hypothetical protein MRX96_039563 [Rhipicephalus microplus]